MTSPYDPVLLSETLGALHIGATLAAILFGVTNLQAVIYYKKYRNDRWFYKSAVALLWTLDALHVALGAELIYTCLINFGDLFALGSILWYSFALVFNFYMYYVYGNLAVTFTVSDRGYLAWYWNL
ncbi:hypothetical protein IW261DRAFT_1415895 [Armillaria novae-zelandiae]|uniref:Uncharacterized protein n=1 Tax=Armillaria novae-zelandiae TaxID=153914 RepID=A0AA39UK14_9AGAR|nr:hypothetical protein IW261DRAFT_1415895 [Armillaria novae-zelandiae]